MTIRKSLAIAYCLLFCMPLCYGQGFYKDVFMDGGIKISSRTTLPATQWLDLSLEYLTSQYYASAFTPTYLDSIKQAERICGCPEDWNGVLLYPDGEPRFRLIYMNGGKSSLHGGSLGETGRERIKTFVSNGGSYVGSCAGAFLSSKGVTNRDSCKINNNYLGIFPGWTTSTGLLNSHTAMTVPEDSPLLKYFNFGGRFSIDSVRHNGGCYMSDMQMPEGTEILMKYDYKRKIKGKSIDGKPSSWAYKAGPESGRVVVIGSHPEGAEKGDNLQLMASLIQYALDGQGLVRLKDTLVKGKTRQMYKSSKENDPAHAMIGDRQYHHYAFVLPQNAKNVKIELKGDVNYNLSLYLNRDDFAFRGQAVYADMSRGGEKVLHFESLDAGIWYLSVECTDTVETRKTPWGIEYVGNTTVLNGIPYSIVVNWK